MTQGRTSTRRVAPPPAAGRRGTGRGLAAAGAAGGLRRERAARWATIPAGVSGDSVFVGICLPRTGTYAVPGEDELKGFELAIEHLNTGNDLIKQISPHTTKGVLGKEVKYGVANSEAKPNAAVQAQTRFITQDKAMMICGSVSSAVAVALNKLAERSKVIYLPGITGSNDTTGKDCSRYSFRQCFYAYTAAACAGAGADQEHRQEQEDRLPDAGLHLWPHRAAVDAGVPGEGRLDRRHQPGLPAGHARTSAPTC